MKRFNKALKAYKKTFKRSFRSNKTAILTLSILITGTLIVTVSANTRLFQGYFIIPSEFNQPITSQIDTRIPQNTLDVLYNPDLLTITGDITAPILTIESPSSFSSSAVYLPGQTFNFYASARDNESTVTSITAQHIGTPVTLIRTSTTGNVYKAVLQAPTTAGEYQVQVTATSSGGTSTLTRTYRVLSSTAPTPTPDTTAPLITITTPSADLQSYNPNAPLTITAQVTDSESPVTLVEASFNGTGNRTPLTRIGSTNNYTTTVTTPGTAQAYQITVYASSSGGTKQAARTYRVASSTTTPPPTLDNAQLISPSNGNNNVSLYPTFSWESLANRESYLLQIATDSSFSNVVRDRSGSSTTYAFSEPLNNSTTYYWRVRATKTDGTTYTYPYNVFTTVAGTVPTPPPTTPGNVQVNFSGSRTTTTEGEKNINLTVTLSSALSFDLDVPVTLRSSSTAVNGSDFTLPSSEFIRFNRGETSRTYTVRLYDDNIRELDKTVILRLNSFNFPSNVSIGSNNTYTITIEDNDGGLTRTPILPGMAISCEKYFIDVDRYDSLCSQLEYLYVNGIFKGQTTPSGNRASLNTELKRSEYFAIASRLLGRENMRVGSLSNLLNRFRDLTPQTVNDRNNSWWLTATAQLEGYVRGYGPEGQKTLEAARVTTEAEIAKVALEGKFRDFTNRDYINPWYSDTQDYMAQYGFYIDPTRNATRADAVELLYVILQIEQDRNFYRNFAY